MLISQKKAKATLRKRTGLSIETVENIIRKLPKTADGAREKVDSDRVEKIAEFYTEPEVSGLLSMRNRRRILFG